ncbi:MAG: class II aldolase/adducin family protein [Rhodospirillales bacterium]
MALSAAAGPQADRVSAEEWAARVDLAACYRMIALVGLDDLIYTHISARVPGPDEHFLINPFGLLYEEVTASNLIKVDLEGRLLDESPWEINPAGFVIHSCVHGARADVACVIHTHSVAGTAVSAQAGGLLPLTQTALLYKDLIGYHDYEGLALEDGEQARLLDDLGAEKRLLILRNHGLLSCGRSVPEAFIMMYYLEQACRMQIAAQAGGRLHLPAPEVQEKAHRQAMTGLGKALGSREFAALRRKLDRQDPSYKT